MATHHKSYYYVVAYDSLTGSLHGGFVCVESVFAHSLHIYPMNELDTIYHIHFITYWGEVEASTFVSSSYTFPIWSPRNILYSSRTYLINMLMEYNIFRLEPFFLENVTVIIYFTHRHGSLPAFNNWLCSNFYSFISCCNGG